MHSSDRAVELGSALETHLRDIRFPLTAPTECEIQRQVCEYVDELKQLGLPPERIIVAVKHAAKEAGLFASPTRLLNPKMRLDGKDKLLVDMVGWCIERYYGEPRAD